MLCFLLSFAADALALSPHGNKNVKVMVLATALILESDS